MTAGPRELPGAEWTLVLGLPSFGFWLLLPFLLGSHTEQATPLAWGRVNCLTFVRSIIILLSPTRPREPPHTDTEPVGSPVRIYVCSGFFFPVESSSLIQLSQEKHPSPKSSTHHQSEITQYHDASEVALFPQDRRHRVIYSVNSSMIL